MKKARFNRIISVLLVVAMMSCMLVSVSAAEPRSDILAGKINTDGTRIRSSPVTGAVVGLAYVGDDMRIDDMQYGSDGYRWYYGPVHNTSGAPVYGWVREDLVDTYFV